MFFLGCGVSLKASSVTRPPGARSVSLDLHIAFALVIEGCLILAVKGLASDAKRTTSPRTIPEDTDDPFGVAAA